MDDHNDKLEQWVMATIIAASVALIVLVTRPACADHLDDLRNARRAGLPTISLWPDGFSLAWQLDQIDAGHRLIPTVRLPLMSDPDATNAHNSGKPAPIFARESTYRRLGAMRLPMVLRGNNINGTFGLQKTSYPGMFAGYRVVYPTTAPLISQNMNILAYSPIIVREPKTPFDVTRDLFDQQGPPCAFADERFWRLEGARVATSFGAARLQEWIPEPTAIESCNNNEGDYDAPSNYRGTGTGGLKPDADIRQKSVRASDWLRSNPTATYDDLVAEIKRRQVIHYRAWEKGFHAALPDTWRSVPFATTAYTSASLERPSVTTSGLYDVYCAGNSPTTYLGFHSKQVPSLINASMCRIFNAVPMWEAQEASDPASWRDLSISISDGGAVQGAQSGDTEIITPERFAAWWTFGLWALRGNQRSVNIRWYQDNGVKNDDPFFSIAPLEFCRTNGYPEAATVTHGDYFMALVERIDEIHASPTLRRFYGQGTPIVTPGPNPFDSYLRVSRLPSFPPAGVPDTRRRWLDVDVNTPVEKLTWKADPYQNWQGGAIKVWATATWLGDEILIFAATPCRLGMVNVTVPGAGVFPVDVSNPRGCYRMFRLADRKWEPVE